LEEEAPGGVEERGVGNLEEEPLEPINTYEGRKQQAISKVKAMEGEEVTVGRGKGRAREEVTWTVIPESHPEGCDLQDDSSPSIVSSRLGLREIDAILRKAGYDILLAFIFIFISFKDWEEKLEKLNEAVSSESQSSAISSLSANNTPPAVALAERVLTDAQGGLHHQCTYPVRPNTAGKKRTMTRECALCRDEGRERKLVGTYCFECKVPLCCPSKWNSDRDCFEGHVSKIRRISGRGV